MKKTFLLTSITIISAMAINGASAQYYKEGNTGYNNNNRGYENRYDNHGYQNYHDNDFRADWQKEVREKRDINFDRRRIAELQNAMQADRYYGNWEAFRYHERELQYIYNDMNRDRERMYGHDRDDRRDDARR